MATILMREGWQEPLGLNHIQYCRTIPNSIFHKKIYLIPLLMTAVQAFKGRSLNGEQADLVVLKQLNLD